MLLVGETPTCPSGCGAPFEPICPTYRCPGRRIPLAILHAERENGSTRYGVGSEQVLAGRSR